MSALIPGDQVVINGEQKTVTSITSNNLMNVDSFFSVNSSALSITKLVPSIKIRSVGNTARVNMSGADGVQIFNTADSNSLSIVSTGTTNSEIFELSGKAGTGINNGKAFSVQVNGNTMASGMFYTDGAYGIGDGSSARDVYLRRSGSKTLMIDSDKAGAAAHLRVTGSLQLNDASGGEYTGWKAPATVPTSVVYTLPDAPAADRFLMTDALGVTSWARALSPSGGTMSGDLNFGTNKATNLGTPTGGGDAVNKTYADARLAGSTVNTTGITTGKVLVWNQTLNGNTGGWEVGTASTTDATRVLKTGDVMTGALEIHPGSAYNVSTLAVDVRANAGTRKDVALTTYDAAPGANSNFIMQRSGGNMGAPSDTPAGERLGGIQFNGTFGANFVQGAYIDARTLSPTTANGVSSAMTFWTSDGSDVPQPRMSIAGIGGVQIPDPGGHGGNVPHLCSQVTATSSALTVTASCASMTEIVTGGGGVCGTGNMIANQPTSTIPQGWMITCSGIAASTVHAICCAY